jgi:hypothetical protein
MVVIVKVAAAKLLASNKLPSRASRTPSRLDNICLPTNKLVRVIEVPLFPCRIHAEFVLGPNCLQERNFIAN